MANNLYSLLLSFCSVGYQILIASFVCHNFGGELFIYPLMIAFNILGLFFGSLVPERTTIKDLIKIEIIIILIALLSIPLLVFFSINSIIFLNILTIGIILTFLFGFFTGFELPILSKNNLNQILILDYLGALLFSLGFAFIFTPMLGFFYTFGILIAINLMCLISLIKQKKLFFLLFFLIPWISFNNGKYLNWKYEKDDFKISSIERSYYQEIITTKKCIDPLCQDFFLKGYLNSKLQFYNKKSDGADFYHYSMVTPFLSIFPSIKRVLILGGGDGLPLKELVKHNVDVIHMLDLDEKWVSFAKTDNNLTQINNNSFNDPRLQLFFDDAFQFVIKNKNVYDLILIDFPESDNLAGVRVHSIQFKRDLFKLLSEEGIVVVQNDTHSYEGTSKLLMNTLKSANFYPMFGQAFNTNYAGDNITQFIGFKKEDSKEKYAKKYKSLESKFKKIIYTDKFIGSENKYKNDILSIYDPTGLNEEIKLWLRNLFHEK